ncbi:MAG: TlpA family protein disulfide reductase [Polyangiaceae bacterium]|nr:TlpA family protein disulfide reductase [Polyangiaceae bacterium]
MTMKAVKLYSSAIMLLALAGSGCASSAAQGDGAAEPASGGGKAAPEITASFVVGDGPKSISEAKGKVVIVDFWATYCDPCKKSFPKYQELVDQFGGDLAVIAVSVDEPGDVGEDKLKEFANETGVKFPILWDKDHKTADLYKPPNMPTSYVLDKEGNIRHVHAKYESGEEAKIADEVRKLLGQ